MKVAELIKRLQKMPQHAIVTMRNDGLFINGTYEVTSMETYDCGEVEICTDYKHRLEDD